MKVKKMMFSMHVQFVIWGGGVASINEAIPWFIPLFILKISRSLGFISSGAEHDDLEKKPSSYK